MKDFIFRAVNVIPDGGQTRSKCFYNWGFQTVPLYASKAKGPYIYDVSGKKYIDTMAALGPIILGYNHRSVVRAVKKQLSLGNIYSTNSEIEVYLAEELTRIIPCCEMVKFGKNGTDVTSIAIRLARHITGKDVILTPNGHYHGWSDSFAAGTDRNSGVPKCLTELIKGFKYNDLEDLEKNLTNDVAAVIMEPCRYEDPDPGFLSGIRRLCNQHNILLIFDEIVTSFRWTLGGAQSYYNVTPDLATIGKAMANGMAVSALVGRMDLMTQLEAAKGIMFSGTFLGEAIPIAAALETINVLKSNPEIYTALWNNSISYCNEFNDHCKKIGINAYMEGFGPVLRAVFESDLAERSYHACMAEQGVFSGKTVILTWAHKQRHLEKIISASKNSLSWVNDGGYIY